MTHLRCPPKQNIKRKEIISVSLEQAQLIELRERAHALRVSVSELVRRGVDKLLDDSAKQAPPVPAGE
jgi:hypothetical protein